MSAIGCRARGWRAMARAVAIAAVGSIWLGIVLGVAAFTLQAPAAAAAVDATGQPHIAIICLDTNVSPARSQLSDERQAALAYLQALPADVKAGLITFNSGWRTVVSPTISRTRMTAALAAVKSAGSNSTALGSAVAGAAAVIFRSAALTGSRILVLSDGESLAKQVKATSVPVDVVSWYFDSDDNVRLVRALATSSGGQVAAPAQVASLAGLFPAVKKPVARPSSHANAASAKAPATRPARLPVSLIAGVFVVLFILILLGLQSLRSSQRRPQLLSQIERYGPRAAAPATAQQGDGRLAQTAVGLMRQVLSSGDAEPRLAQRLDRAGITRQPAEWALVCVCVCAGLAAVFTLLLGNVFAGVLIGVVVGWIGMRLVLSVKIDRRRAAFDEQLPNGLQLMAGSLQTGLSLSQSLDAVVRENAQPMSGEFARAVAEARLGVDVDVALDGIASRMESADLRWVIMAIRIQRETGGNLAEVLRTTVATMRERAFLRRQVRSLSAEGRLSAYVLVGLPIFVGGWLFFANPSYMHPLYSTFLGIAMLVLAVILVVVGAFWLRNLINVKV